MDDWLENIDAASRLGIHAILHPTAAATIAAINALIATQAE